MFWSDSYFSKSQGGRDRWIVWKLLHLETYFAPKLIALQHPTDGYDDRSKTPNLNMSWFGFELKLEAEKINDSVI